MLGNSDTINTTQSFSLMRYVLFDDHFDEVGTYDSIYELRKFLCDRKYEVDCDKDIGDTFDYIKSIKWHFDIKQDSEEQCQAITYHMLIGSMMR